MEFDFSDPMKGLGRKVARSAMRTTENRNAFDDEQVRATAISPRDQPDGNSITAAVLAKRFFAVIPHIQ